MRRPPAAVGALMAIAAGAAVVGVGLWLATASLQQDFAAYWIAGRACRLGLDPYVNHVGSPDAGVLWDGIALFRHSRFLYPPLVAELFRPLAALPYRAAKLLFTGAMLAVWAAAGLLGGDRRSRIWFFGASALYFPLYRHFERGQVDLLILFLLALAWRTRARPPMAGAALALGMLFKPGLVMLLPVLWAGGRARVVGAALGAGLALIGLTAVIAGPARLHEYLSSVLPRAALYGEGGTPQMLLPPDRFPSDRSEADGAGPDDAGSWLDGHRYRASRWEVSAAASLPRWLAPESPNYATNFLPAGVAVLGLGWAARRLRGRSTRRDAPDDTGENLLLFSSAVACVIASPSGWVMGLVVALPLAARAAGLWIADGRARAVAPVFTLAWVAVALPAPFAGFPALAGAALVAAGTWAALTARTPTARVTA